MPKCPNCGRETYRTEDWACQWCGHPLLSSAFKIVPKTYRQIQEERAYGVKPALEDEPEAALATEVAPAPPEAPEPEPPQMLEPEPETEPEMPAPPEPVAEIEPEVEVKSKAAAPSEPEAEAVAESEPPAPPEPVEVKEDTPEAEVEEAKAEAEPVPVSASEAEPAAEIAPEVETKPTQAPTPAAAPDLEPEATTGVINATVEELNAAFNSDKAGANAKLMDKTLRITGTVDKVFVRDNLDIFYIILAGAGGPSSWQIRCTFNREHSAHLSRLTAGQNATVQGTYTGYERNIILKECSLAQ